MLLKLQLNQMVPQTPMTRNYLSNSYILLSKKNLKLYLNTNQQFFQLIPKVTLELLQKVSYQLEV